MSMVDRLITAMAEYEVAYGVKPHEIKITHEAYETLREDAASKGMTPFPSVEGDPLFNGAKIVLVDAIPDGERWNGGAG